MTDESVKEVEKFVMKDRRVSVQHIASEISIFVGSVETILYDPVNLFKVSAKWVPRLLTSEQKIMRK